jgi:hypothetical protein
LSIILLGVDEYHFKVLLVASLLSSVADPDPGSGAFLTPGSGIRNRFFPDPRSGSRIQDPKPIFSPLTFVAVLGSGKGKNQDPGSGVNIPDPPHCLSVLKIPSESLYFTALRILDPVPF